MIEFILDNFWTCLFVSSIPAMIAYPWSVYKSRQADEKLISDLTKLLKDDITDTTHDSTRI